MMRTLALLGCLFLIGGAQAQNAPKTKSASPVTALAFSPDGKTLAVGTYREAQLWNVETRTKARVFAGHADNILALAFSPDGAKLAAGGGVPTDFGEVKVWEVATGKPIQTLKEHTDTVCALGFTPNGERLVTGSTDKSLRLWDWAAGKALKVMKDHADAVYALALTPDGKKLASTGVDRSIKLWDAETGKPLYTFTGRAHGDTVFALEFSKDGKTLLSAGGDKIAKFWIPGKDAESVTQPRAFSAHENAILSAAFLPTDNSLIATGSADKTVRIWKAADGGAVATLTEPTDWVYAVRFSPDGAFLAAGTWSGNVYLWKMPERAFLGAFSVR